MIAVLPIREGIAPLGAEEVLAEAGGAAFLIGSGCREAGTELRGLRRGWTVEAGPYQPGAWANGLAGILPDRGPVLLPASPDGRDLAPRLAYALDLPLLAGARQVTDSGAALARWDARVESEVEVDGSFVATLIPGAPATVPARGTPELSELEWVTQPGIDAEIVEVSPPDPRTADLTESSRILAAGAGVVRGDPPNGTEAIGVLQTVADALSASLGATRVVTDAGFVSYERQIGTTGVVVAPELYIAFGISGAAQHTGGVGDPKHVVSVNTDPSCPMTAIADLGIVTDATALLLELASRLGTREITHA